MPETKKARFLDSICNEYETIEKAHDELNGLHYKTIAVDHLPINIADWAGIKSIVAID